MADAQLDSLFRTLQSCSAYTVEEDAWLDRPLVEKQWEAKGMLWTL